jgi:hypothetical protein
MTLFGPPQPVTRQDDKSSTGKANFISHKTFYVAVPGMSYLRLPTIADFVSANDGAGRANGSSRDEPSHASVDPAAARLQGGRPTMNRLP